MEFEYNDGRPGNPVFRCPECAMDHYEQFTSGVVTCVYCGHREHCEHLAHSEGDRGRMVCVTCGEE